LQCGGISDGGFKPAGLVLGIQNHRHPVMNWGDPGISGGDQEGSGFEDLAVPLPAFP
jgi:hypothetical protein